MFFNELLKLINYNFTLFIIFPSIICVGCYLTLKLKFVQIAKLKKSLISLTKTSEGSDGKISRFGAVSSVLAGNFGTGNISGMAVAIAAGGPGALVWMWIMAFFGAAIQYASCVLGISYRKKMENNEYAGGPMYYLRDGLGLKKIAILFSLFTLFGAITVGNFAQINSIVLPLEKMGLNPIYCSIVIALFVGIVMLGGIQRLAHFASLIVPFKALLYLGTAAIIIGMNYDKALDALHLMIQHAFGFSSFIGGAMGISVFKAISTGFDRGLFATDAGTGIVPILQANARSTNPVIDGISTLIAPLMVMIVCTATGVVLILTEAWLQTDLKSTNMVTYAFSKGLESPMGGYIVLISLILFAYTSIMAWAYCGEKALEFLIGPSKKHWFCLLYVLFIPIGAVLNVDLIWVLADISISFMLILNLIGIAGLSKFVIESSREHSMQLA